jgi:hypothetical protein
MLELIDGLPGNIVGVAASGRVTMRDCQNVLVPAIKKSRKRHDKIRLYYELNSRFPGAAWDDLDLGLEHASCCERVAIVTDIGWVRLTVKALRFLIPSEIRVFATIQAEEDRAWIRARPGVTTTIQTTVPVPTGQAPPRRVRNPPPKPTGAPASVPPTRRQTPHRALRYSAVEPMQVLRDEIAADQLLVGVDEPPGDRPRHSV